MADSYNESDDEMDVIEWSMSVKRLRNRTILICPTRSSVAEEFAKAFPGKIASKKKDVALIQLTKGVVWRLEHYFTKYKDRIIEDLRRDRQHQIDIDYKKTFDKAADYLWHEYGLYLEDHTLKFCKLNF
jgi:hypothetical protein